MAASNCRSKITFSWPRTKQLE